MNLPVMVQWLEKLACDQRQDKSGWEKCKSSGNEGGALEQGP